MNKKLLRSVREYKKQSVLAPVLVILEVLMEVLIPLEMAKIIDVGIANGDMSYIIQRGVILVAIQIISDINGLVMVTPLAGVWIEITSHYTIIGGDWSLPLRECGLKLVSAHMGARTGGHSPCGSVD